MAHEPSFAAVHRQASREIDRQLMNRALAKVWDATHVVTWHDKIYFYGSKAEAEDFAEGLGRAAKVRPITTREQHQEALHKRKAFGNP